MKSSPIESAAVGGSSESNVTRSAALRLSWPAISERRFDVIVGIFFLVTSILWSAFSGKDMDWDQLQYHFYLPYSLFNERLGQDVLPASGQSYLNPLAYVPFYWMVMQQWHSLLIASLLAAVHSLNAVLIYLIAKKLFASDNRDSRAVSVAAGALGFLCPVFLAEVGTSYADITTSLFVLTAVILGMQSDRETPAWRNRAAVAGLSMGFAGALKLSNLAFGPALALMLLVVNESTRDRIRSWVLLATGSVVGFLVGHGYWGFKLWQEFHDSQHSLVGALLVPNLVGVPGAPSERFLPMNMTDVLLQPFHMVELRSWIYTEVALPDLRLAALVIFALLGGLYLFVRHRRTLNLEGTFPKRYSALFVFFIAAYGLWQWTSGNGRYALPVLMLAAPILAMTIYWVFLRGRMAYWVLGVLIVLQCWHLTSVAGLRFSSVDWTAQWYPLSIPERLKKEPYLYLSVGPFADSYIYPFLPKDSAFANPIGQVSVEFDSPAGERLTRLLQKYRGRVRIIAATSVTNGSSEVSEKHLAHWNKMNDSFISRLGLAIDTSDCEDIQIAATSRISQPKSSASSHAGAADVSAMRTCRLVERPFEFAEERAQVTAILQEVVDSCPKLFRPTHTVLERIPGGWQASYNATDSLLIVFEHKIVGLQTGAWADFLFGTIEEWQKGIRPSCSEFPDNPRRVYRFD